MAYNVIGTSSYTRGSGCTSDAALTYASISKMMQTIASLPPEPIGAWMRAKGCPPEEWMLYLPKYHMTTFGPHSPSYACYVEGDYVVLVKNREKRMNPMEMPYGGFLYNLGSETWQA